MCLLVRAKCLSRDRRYHQFSCKSPGLADLPPAICKKARHGYYTSLNGLTNDECNRRVHVHVQFYTRQRDINMYFAKMMGLSNSLPDSTLYTFVLGASTIAGSTFRALTQIKLVVMHRRKRNTLCL